MKKIFVLFVLCVGFVGSAMSMEEDQRSVKKSRTDEDRRPAKRFRVDEALQVAVATATLDDITATLDGVKHGNMGKLDLHKNLYEYHKNVLAEVARQHYLLNPGAKFLDVGVNYGFSVKELLDHNKLRPIRNGDLDLSYFEINNLEGIELIENADTITSINLEGNQIGVVPDKIFSNFSNVSDLNLTDNDIEEIKSCAFEGLTKIESIRLKDNYLANDLFLIDLIKKCGRVRNIDCENNKIGELSDTLLGFFRALENKEDITVGLCGNPLEEETVNILGQGSVVDYQDGVLRVGIGLYDLISPKADEPSY